MSDIDLKAIEAVANDCANSRFATIRQIAAHMNDLLTLVADLQGRADSLADQVAGRDEQIGRVRELARHPYNSMGRVNRYVLAAELLVALDGEPESKETGDA